MYPNFNYIMSPLFQGQQQMQPLGQMPGQVAQPGAQISGLGQFAGLQPSQQPQQQQGHSPGFLSQFGPLFGMAGMMGSSAPYWALGGLLGYGLHKAKVF